MRNTKQTCTSQVELEEGGILFGMGLQLVGLQLDLVSRVTDM